MRGKPTRTVISKLRAHLRLDRVLKISLLAEHRQQLVRAVSSRGSTTSEGKVLCTVPSDNSLDVLLPVPQQTEALSGLQVDTTALPSQAHTAVSWEACPS